MPSVPYVFYLGGLINVPIYEASVQLSLLSRFKNNQSSTTWLWYGLVRKSHCIFDVRKSHCIFDELDRWLMYVGFAGYTRWLVCRWPTRLLLQFNQGFLLFQLHLEWLSGVFAVRVSPPCILKVLSSVQIIYVYSWLYTYIRSLHFVVK